MKTVGIRPRKKMMICRSSIVCVLILLSQYLAGQELLGVSMLWDHDPTQWTLYAEREEDDGLLQTFDHLDARKFFWDFEVYDSKGRIWNLFPEQYNQWRLQSDTLSISMQTVFMDRWAEWRISDGQHTLTLRAAGLSNPFYWIIDHPEFGKWEMYSLYENDPRDWEIVDTLSNQIPLEMKVAAGFLVLVVNWVLL